jgi:precorrin-3B synthase
MSAAAKARMRRGACPALSAPMQTGDGLLVRLNLVEGGMTPEELAALCELAARHGNGIVEVTARGSFQIRGLTLASAPLLEADVSALDLPLREGVPVETSTLAGLDPQETADPLPLARAIRAAVAAAGLSGQLGPKVSVVVDAGGAVDLSDILADVRLTAVRQHGAVRWRLAIGGNARPAGSVAVLEERDAVAAVIAVLETIAARGMDTRGRDLPPSVLPDIFPSRGEIGCHDGFRKSATFQKDSQQSGHPISPLEGEMSGRTEGGRRPLSLKDSRLALTVALPFGSMEAAGLAAFARQAACHGVVDIRLAPGRSLILLCPTPAAARLVAGDARSHGLILDPADPRRTIAACPGAPACASGRIATRALAWRLAERGNLPGSVHVSGCAKGCAHPSPARIVLVGTEAGLALVRDGRAGDKPTAIFPDAEAALAALAALPEPAE